MTAREAGTLAAILMVMAALAAVFVAQPTYMDAYYYFNSALALARGQGLTDPYVWNYLAPVRSLPAPSHLYWMPLASLVSAPFVAVGAALQPTASQAVLFRAAQVPMVLAAAGLAGFTGAVAWRVTGQRRHVWAGAVMTLLSAFYLPFWPATDSFALFGLAAAGALWLYPQSPAEGRPAARWRAALAAGVLAGLAHLARADGLLVAVSLGLSELGALLGPERSGPAARRAAARLAALALGYLAVMGPWFVRNLLVVGAPLATGGLAAVWLTHYDELFWYRPEALTAARFLAQGWGAIWTGRVEALVAAVQSLVAAQASIMAFPFALIGAWQLRRRPEFQRAAVYGGVLFLAMTLAFTYPGMRGGFLHSGTALLPFSLPAALVGLDAAVDWAGRRLRHWRPERSRPVFMALLVAGFAALALTRLAAPAARSGAAYAEIGDWLGRAGAGPGAVVAVNNPPAFYYHTGLAAIVIPSDGRPAVLDAMRAFGARWLVLDVNVPADLAALYQAGGQDPDFRVRAEFRDADGRPVYLLEMEAASAPAP